MKLKIFILICLFLFKFFFLMTYFGSMVEKKEKTTPFESGFSTLGKVNSSYSVHYFLLILIFVLFDLEIIFLLIIIFTAKSYYYLFLVVLVMVILGLILEWKMSKMIWFV